MKVSVIANESKDADFSVTRKVIEKMSQIATVSVSETLLGVVKADVYAKDADLYRGRDMALVLGGDGTLLAAARRAAPYGTPVLGINLGRIGFLTGVEKDAFLESDIENMMRHVRIESRMMLRASVWREGEEIAAYCGLNEASVRNMTGASLLRLAVKADGRLLGAYAADGIIVATPTGSTAYSFAAGGPAVHPELSALLVTPICPHMLHARPVVLPGESVLEAEVGDLRGKKACLTVDGADSTELYRGDLIRIEKADHAAKIAALHNHMFFEVLRNKLQL